jgi:hypothetical protein
MGNQELTEAEHEENSVEPLSNSLRLLLERDFVIALAVRAWHDKIVGES